MYVVKLCVGLGVCVVGVCSDGDVGDWWWSVVEGFVKIGS